MLYAFGEHLRELPKIDIPVRTGDDRNTRLARIVTRAITQAINQETGQTAMEQRLFIEQTQEGCALQAVGDGIARRDQRSRDRHAGEQRHLTKNLTGPKNEAAPAAGCVRIRLHAHRARRHGLEIPARLSDSRDDLALCVMLDRDLRAHPCDGFGREGRKERDFRQI